MTIGSLARSKFLHLVLTGSLICVLPARTFAWSDKAHRIIAALTWLKLKDDTKRQVRDLLASKSSDPYGPLVAVASWADLQGLQYPEQRKWHFVDIPLSALTYDEKRDCSDGNCIVKKLDEKKWELQFGKNKQTRAAALKYLVHLIGDLHQPLHCADNGDSAGNRVVVKFLGKVTNLHKVWDSDMIERTGMPEGKYVDKLRAIEVSRGYWFADWANDSHMIARKYAYAIPKDKELGTTYYRSNLPILERQLAIAAEKLAQVLEDALPPPSQQMRRGR